MPTQRYERTIHAPISVVFDLCRSIDFHVWAAKSIRAQAVGGRISGHSELGDRTTYAATIFGLTFRITTEVVTLNPPYEFDEQMVKGLFRTFSHRYRLTADGDHTLLQDSFSFQSPLGVFGKVADLLLFSSLMAQAENERLDAIKHAAEDPSSNFR